MTKQELVRELQELANSHWMMARQSLLSNGERKYHTRAAQVIEEAIDLLRQLPD